MLTLLFLLMVASLAMGMVIAWMGPSGPWEPDSDPIGSWDEVEASLAYTRRSEVLRAVTYQRAEVERLRKRVKRGTAKPQSLDVAKAMLRGLYQMRDTFPVLHAGNL